MRETPYPRTIFPSSINISAHSELSTASGLKVALLGLLEVDDVPDRVKVLQYAMQ